MIMGATRDGARLALTTFTVAPVRSGRIDRHTAGIAMSLAPLVGAVLGAVLAGAGLGLRWLGAPAPVAGAVTVALGVLLTRALHVDGLADTADGLGSYRGPEGALEIMKKPDVGPFGVAAVVLALLIQATAAATLLTRPAPTALAGIVTATAAGRLAVSWSCRRGVPAARPDGLGALVAGTVSGFSALAGLALTAALAVTTAPHQPWRGPAAVAVSLAAGLLLVRHAIRRIGGVTGDVLGAVVEVTTTVAYIGLAI
jgi:adenosylcobinamide-GDP ribazoletransferase